MISRPAWVILIPPVSRPVTGLPARLVLHVNVYYALTLTE